MLDLYLSISQSSGAFSLKLTHLSQIDLPTLIGRKSSFPILRVLGFIIIIIRFLFNVQVHHPHQWAPFQVAG